MAPSTGHHPRHVRRALAIGRSPARSYEPRTGCVQPVVSPTRLRASRALDVWGRGPLRIRPFAMCNQQKSEESREHLRALRRLQHPRASLLRQRAGLLPERLQARSQDNPPIPKAAPPKDTTAHFLLTEDRHLLASGGYVTRRTREFVLPREFVNCLDSVHSPFLGPNGSRLHPKLKLGRKLRCLQQRKFGMMWRP